MSFHVISIIVYNSLKSCLKTIVSKAIKKTIKFALRNDQERRVVIIKSDALSSCSLVKSIAFVAGKIDIYQMHRFASSNVEKICFTSASKSTLGRISKTLEWRRHVALSTSICINHHRHSIYTKSRASPHRRLNQSWR